MRVTVLWTELSGYLTACLRVLAEEHDVSLQVFRIQREQSNPYFRPYQDALFEWIPELITLPDSSLKHEVLLYEKLSHFKPDVLLINGWRQPVYRRIARQMRQKGIFTICGGVDNQWQGTLKQWLGVLTARWFLHPTFDALWVTGERATLLARKFGFTGHQLLQGFYACDRKLFEPVAEWRFSQPSQEVGWPRCFLFTGRLAEEKGIRNLLAAYQIYRHHTDKPYELWLAGSGPLESWIKNGNTPGVKFLGFLQPDVYADTLKQVGVFILPSHFEPWGVVIHEAISSALPVLCTHQCGASVELVHQGHNGFVFEAGNVALLADLMHYISSGTISLPKLGERSFALSAIYTPDQWANRLMTHLRHH